MSVTRRGFLGLLATTAAGVAIAPELAELLKPRPTIFLPPKGGWGSQILMCEMISRESLLILHQNIMFHPSAFVFDGKRVGEFVSVLKSVRYESNRIGAKR